MSIQQSEDVLGLAWPDFLTWIAPQWRQGEHLNIAGPTGAGKTTLGTGLLGLRRYVVAVDVKAGDDTLDATRWPRISGKPDRLGQWLPYEQRKQLNDGEPVRVIAGHRARSFAGLHDTWAMTGRLLEAIFVDGMWTVYCPDLQLLTDPNLGGIKTSLDMMWIAARSRRVSLVTDLQEFAWSPRLVRSMPRWFACGYTRDLDSVEAMGRAAGRSAAETRGMIAALRQRDYSWLIFSNNPRLPVVCTVPDPSMI